MIRTLHLVHKREWQKDLERWEQIVMWTQTPGAVSTRQVPHPAAPQSISSIVRLLSVLHCPLQRPNAQSHWTQHWTQWTDTERSWVLAERSCAHSHIHTINTYTHTACKRTYSTHAHTRLHTHTYGHKHALTAAQRHKAGVTMAGREGQTHIQAPMGLRGYTHTYIYTNTFHTKGTKSKGLHPEGRE